jgi:hypothetical protein
VSGQGPAQGNEGRKSGSQSVAERSPRKKVVAWVAGVGSLAIGAFVTAYFTTLGNHAAALLPRTTSPTASPSASSSPWETGSLTVAESAKYYRVSLPIYNRQTSDRFVAQISIGIDRKMYSKDCGGGPSPGKFTLKGHLFIIKKTGAARSAVLAGSGAASGFSVPALGRDNWSTDCSTDNLSLAFPPPALVLKKHSTTTIVIDIPKRMTVTAYTDPSGKNHSVRVYTYRDLTDLVNPMSGYYQNTAYIMITLTTRFTSGSALSFCRELRGDTWQPSDQVPGCPSEG